MALSEPFGFALRRNGTCLADIEVDCGRTVAPFHACCPTGSSCPSQFNVDCCPDAENCTQKLLEEPSCANRTWTLYDNDGYFCCAPGTRGYNQTLSNSSGCSDPGAPPRGAVLLRAVSAGQTMTTSTSSTSTSTSTPSTSSAGLTSTASTSVPTSFPVSSTIPGSPESTPDAQPSSGDKPSIAAIAGGVVGGIVAIAFLVFALWFFWYRKRTARIGNHTSRVFEKDAVSSPNEIEGRPINEMLADSKMRNGPAAELHGGDKVGSYSRAELP